MTLSAAEMAQMSFLLDEAIPLDAAARRQWIEQLSPEYRKLTPVLRQSLLPQTDTGSAAIGLDTLPKLSTGADDRPPTASDFKPGERFGPYRLVRQLGVGGMAEVWLARRADGAFTRQVAVKLPMRSRVRPDLAPRFAYERDILANLEHPNIVRMYDAGQASDGLLYLAMEYVRGEPLIDWCDAHRAGLPERIKLFLQVLDAVQYAHDQHVVHRDLKPSNILVTQQGQVRLLDFGVATRLSDPENRSTQLTRLYGRALTPDYASPELVRGEAADAASDVYSLGVVLYELLSGSRPYRINARASATLLERKIATVRIRRPSTQLALKAGAARATTQRRLAQLLCGDLDAIVLKALSPRRCQRYPSVSALADDLWRYLEGRSVEARSAPPLRRTGKFLIRHWTDTAATLAVLAALGLALIQALPLLPPNAGAGIVHPGERSIAVLPFVDMSENKDQEYFLDGMAEEVRDLLSDVPGLHVVARTSSSYFKDKQATIGDISRALGVTHVLEGSVRHSGSHLRVSARLVRADNGFQVWTETYDRDLDDLFKVQDEIASAVVEALKASLLTQTPPEPTAIVAARLAVS